MITPKVRILKRNLIDDNKWNLSISQAANSLPYAYTWYLDALCSRWVGLIVGDYEFIMPLPIGRKWGMLYVYQPMFCQQLGVFYKWRSEPVIRLMVTTALSKFVFVNLNLNSDNNLKEPVTGATQKKNLVLALTGKHSAIQKRYSENTLRNIKKGLKAGLIFEESNKRDFDAFADLYIRDTVRKDSTFRPRHLKALKQLVQQFIIHDCGRLFVAKTSEGTICAGVIVVESGNRIIHLIPSADDYARRNGGMHYVIDAVLAHYADSGKVYDFEGSSVESIARFYEGFGAVDEPFSMVSKSAFKFLMPAK